MRRVPILARRRFIPIDDRAEEPARTHRALMIGLGLAGVVLLLAAVGILTRSGGTAARAEAHAAVQVARSRLGRILVNRQGRTYYAFAEDRPARSACSGACARVWPPAVVSRDPMAGPGVAAAKLSELRRRDGARQLVYNGHPLYTFAGDSRAGQMGGQAFLGEWFVVSPHGTDIGRSGRSGGGYG